MQPPPKCTTPPGFEELIRTIWSSIGPNRVLNFGGVHFGGVRVKLLTHSGNYKQIRLILGKAPGQIH